MEEYFVEHGFSVDASASGDEGLWFAENHPYDCIILDIMLPAIDGISILRRLRSIQNRTPVIIVSARDSVDQRIEGLNAGADDYVTKPFALNELLARVRAQIRRGYDKESSEVVVGDLRVNLIKKTVARGDEEISLTRREYQLLEYLALRAGQPVSRSEIWEHVYENESGGSSNAVDVYIGYLRRKLNVEGRPDLIHTRRGHGYFLEAIGR